MKSLLNFLKQHNFKTLLICGFLFSTQQLGNLGDSSYLFPEHFIIYRLFRFFINFKINLKDVNNMPIQPIVNQ